MIQSRQKVKDLCDQLMEFKPKQIVIDLVQDDIEELVESDDATPDQIGAMAYQCGILLDVYDWRFATDIGYLKFLKAALDEWEKDATFANKSLGLDPNK